MENKEIFICPTCGKEYKSERFYKQHLETHESKNVAEKQEIVVEKQPSDNNIKAVKKEKKVYANSDEVLVRNGFGGSLVFVAPKSKYTYIFDEFGDEEYIEFEELRAAKGGKYAGFFKKQWLLIDDPNAIEQLKLGKYFDNALTYDDFEDLFDLSISALKAKVGTLTKSQKDTLAYITMQKIDNGELTDLNMIKVLEESLGEDLYIK